jgi:thymidylate synthase
MILQMHNEKGYISLVKHVLDNGTSEETRNGTTISTFGEMMKFSLENNTVPFITTKKLAWKTCLKELLWFIKGSTSNKELQSQNVHIWDGNGSTEFLKSRNLNYKEGDLGPIYGFQWRHFNAPYTDCYDNYEGMGIDQLTEIVETLKDPVKRSSRRIILSAWNPCQISEMALPPCHVLCQFHVSNGSRLHCCLYQRSGDIGLGVPFNIASYSLLTHIIAKICGLEAYEFTHFLGNAHIYEEHIDALKEQIKNIPKPPPSIEFTRDLKNIDDLNFSDIKINNYIHHDTIAMKMKV